MFCYEMQHDDDDDAAAVAADQLRWLLFEVNSHRKRGVRARLAGSPWCLCLTAPSAAAAAVR